MESKPGSADRLKNLARRFGGGDRWREAERRGFLQRAGEDGLELEAARLLVDEIPLLGATQEESVRATLLSPSLLQALAVLQMKDRGRFEATLDALRTKRGMARLVEGASKGA